MCQCKFISCKRAAVMGHDHVNSEEAVSVRVRGLWELYTLCSILCT